MDGLIEARLAGLAQRRRGQHAERAGQLGRDVRQDVAEQVVGDHDVELLGVLDDLHGRVVGQDVLQLDVGIVAGVQVGDHLAPEQAGIHDVGLLGRGHLVAPAAGQFEGDAGHALDLGGRIDLGVHGALAAGGDVLDEAGRAEIDAAGQLADDHEVQALDHLALQAGGVGERIEAQGRTQVGEHLHAGAKGQQAGFRALVAGGVGPLRPAHRAHQHRLGGLGGGERLLGQRDPVLVIGRAAEQPLGDLQVGGEHAGDLAHLGDHFGADAVAGQEEEVGHGRTFG